MRPRKQQTAVCSRTTSTGGFYGDRNCICDNSQSEVKMRMELLLNCNDTLIVQRSEKT